MYGAVADTRVQYVLLGFSEKYHHIYRFTTSQFLHIFLDIAVCIHWHTMRKNISTVLNKNVVFHYI